MHEGCKGPPKNSFSSPPICVSFIVCQPNKHPIHLSSASSPLSCLAQNYLYVITGLSSSQEHKDFTRQANSLTAHNNVFANRKYIESNSLADALAARWWLEDEGRRRKQRRKVERDTLATLTLSVVMAHPSARTERLWHMSSFSTVKTAYVTNNTLHDLRHAMFKNTVKQDYMLNRKCKRTTFKNINLLECFNCLYCRYRSI